jgi:translation initiation factor eIF-2B subunit epsilon
MPLFGQILAALYQTDIVEEDDIRAWHSLSTSKGEDLPATVDAEVKENYRKTWIVGAQMIHQLDQQSSSEESEEEDDGDADKPAGTVSRSAEASDGDDEDDEDD